MNQKSSIIIFLLIVLIICTGRTGDEAIQGTSPAASRTISDRAKGIKGMMHDIQEDAELIAKGVHTVHQKTHDFTAFVLSKVRNGALKVDMEYINGLLSKGADYITLVEFQEAVRRANQAQPVDFSAAAVVEDSAVRSARAQSIDGESA